MIAKLFLGLQALLLIPYGIYCLANPAMLAGAAGVKATTLTGTIELQAMYGGMQTAVGVLCLLAVLQRAYERPALIALLFIFAGLAVVRVSLGLVHSDFSGYTVGAMSFEAACLLFLLWYLFIRVSPVTSNSP